MATDPCPHATSVIDTPHCNYASCARLGVDREVCLESPCLVHRIDKFGVFEQRDDHRLKDEGYLGIWLQLFRQGSATRGQGPMATPLTGLESNGGTGSRSQHLSLCRYGGVTPVVSRFSRMYHPQSHPYFCNFY